MKMRIGEFAAFSDVSIRALRIYDRMGLLTPASTDPETGYRYYAPEQMQTLNAIIGFKKVGFTLREIKQLLSPKLDTAARIQKLRDKQRENDRIAEICRYNNENIQQILDSWQASPARENDQEAAVRLARIACLENEKLEHDFSQILWL